MRRDTKYNIEVETLERFISENDVFKEKVIYDRNNKRKTVAKDTTIILLMNDTLDEEDVTSDRQKVQNSLLKITFS